MKKILFIAGMLISLPLKANELKCEDSYEYFKTKTSDEMKYYNMRDLDAILEFSNSMDYTMNFKRAITGKDNFFLGEWISKKTFKQHIKTLLAGLDLMNHKYGDFSFERPKINYIYDNLEICVIPTKSQAVAFESKFNTTYDKIFVRDLITDKWKSYIYLGIEKKDDMELLFPELLSKVRLSQILANNMDYVDSNIYIANEMMKVKRILVPKEEVLSALKKRLKHQDEMLKLNGYK